MNCGLKYRSLLFSHKNYLEVGSVVNGSLAQQCSQGFRFYLSSLTSIESWILLFMYAPSHEISIWLPQAQTSCYFQAQMKGACNQEKKKKNSRNPQKMSLTKTGSYYHPWLQKMMRESVYHSFILYSGRQIREIIIGNVLWVNSKPYLLKSANVDFMYLCKHVVKFISTQWWIDGFSVLL